MDYLTTREVAAMLRTSPRAVATWARTARIGAVRVGREWRIPTSAVTAYTARHATGPVDPMTLTPLSAARQETR